ncbi:TPA: hypothetical protein N0F65_007436 [Lagenidium giganteum]|uniref:Endothelin-converting enzyme 1 n=1 Tax=Lagenidium giganteum TaxID=4803 RepID=A0AAV2ZIJ3_9STRA|nr:TPA: hypothetical protein N0F65_007436 [Lagenidium giganteum]
MGRRRYGELPQMDDDGRSDERSPMHATDPADAEDASAPSSLSSASSTAEREVEDFRTRRRCRRIGLMAAVPIACFLLLIVLVSMMYSRRNQDVATNATSKSSSSSLSSSSSPWRNFPADALAMMNTSVQPCDNFYAFACGTWQNETVIPAEKSSLFASFSKVSDENQAVLRAIMDDSWPFVGELYDSCMNMTQINATGVTPLLVELDQLTRAQTKPELFRVAGALSRTGPSFLTGLGVSPDAKDATTYVLYASQTGLSFPDPQYYLDSAMFDEYKDALHANIKTLFELAQWHPEAADANAQMVINLEQQIAKLFVPKEDLEDPTASYHPTVANKAAESYPLLFGEFMAGTGIYEAVANHSDTAGTSADQVKNTLPIIFETPTFFENMEPLVANTSFADLQTLFAYQLLSHFAPRLGEPFIAAMFELYSKKLGGQQQRKPRWQVCLSTTTSAFPDLMGKYYFLKKFNHESEDVAKAMVASIEQVMDARLQEVEWLGTETRAAAIKKLHQVSNLIGHSSTPTHYPFVLDSNEYVGNLRTLAQYEFDKATKRIGETVDRDEWLMCAADVNAYYNPSGNQIVFPAGILQPPFFDSQRHSAQNFGAIGSIIGHELTHGFDDQGRYFDGDGNMVSWWSNETEREFKQRSQCLVDQYGNFTVTGLQGKSLGRVNGIFTLGENIADNGGVKLSYKAWQNYTRTNTNTTGSQATTTSLSSNEAQQLFFLSFAQAFCSKVSDAAMAQRLATDPHSPEQARVNGVMQNNKDFASAFQCAPGSPMNPTQKCELW